MDAARTEPGRCRYFAFGSNMNPERVRHRGLAFVSVEAAWLPGFRLVFDKRATLDGTAHANLAWAPDETVEGVLYELVHDREIEKMDHFERTPVNYSREMVTVHTGDGPRNAWTYVANPALRVVDARPERSYLDHLLAGRPYLSDAYYRRLASWPVSDEGVGVDRSR